jgi:RNA polymerase sigma-70 factor (ECF subfamily)
MLGFCCNANKAFCVQHDIQPHKSLAGRKGGERIVSEPDPIILEWILAVRDKGDQDAFAEIVYSFQDAVYNLCYRMLGERTEAEDATQEAFIRAFGNIDRYDTSRSFKTWLLSIASNHCIDRLRKRRLKYLSLDEPLPTNLQLAISSDMPNPESQAVRNERSEYIQELLDQLSEDDRAGIILKYWYDYSYAEIAEVLDTTESAVKSRLFRARRALADLLTGEAATTQDEEAAINRLSGM